MGLGLGDVGRCLGLGGQILVLSAQILGSVGLGRTSFGLGLGHGLGNVLELGHGLGTWAWGMGCVGAL